jgi:hypothetical protein
MSDCLPVVLQEITVRLVLHPEMEHPVVQVETDDSDTLLQQLGLLEFAKDSVIRQAMGE